MGNKIDEAKVIVSNFINIPVSEINESTIMDYSVVPSSLLLHRMYAVLSDRGFYLDDPSSITTFGDFLKSITSEEKINFPEFQKQEEERRWCDKRLFSIGVDIEGIEKFNPSHNNKDNSFYKSTYSLHEITYCESRPDPVSSFAGLFALKEAIVKADNYYKKVPFNKIEINHLTSGAPVFDGFSVSLSHSDGFVVAVACKEGSGKNIESNGQLLISNESVREFVLSEIRENNKLITKKLVIFMLLVVVLIVLGSAV